MKSRSRLLAWFGIVLCVSFFTSFAVNAPARWLVQRFDLILAEDAVSGTLLHGKIAMDGGFRLTWDVLPLASLSSLKLIADIGLNGPGTDIGGRLELGYSEYHLGPLDGQADAQLLRALFPGMTLRCSGPILAVRFSADLTPRALTGTGALRSDALDCGTGQKVPPLSLRFLPQTDDASAMSGAEISTASTPVLTVTISQEARLTAVLHKAGASLVPGLPSGADSSIEMPLSTLFP